MVRSRSLSPTTASVESCASSSVCSRAQIHGRTRPLLLPEAKTSEEFLDEWIQPGVTRAVVQERMRAESGTVPKGEGYDVYVDALAEFGRNGRVGTWLINVKRVSPSADDWRIAGFTVLTTVRGLYRLSLTTNKAVHNRQPRPQRGRLRTASAERHRVRRGNRCAGSPASSFLAVAK